MGAALIYWLNLLIEADMEINISITAGAKKYLLVCLIDLILYVSSTIY